jgi:hypothetical protein
MFMDNTMIRSLERFEAAPGAAISSYLWLGRTVSVTRIVCE